MRNDASRDHMDIRLGRLPYGTVAAVVQVDRTEKIRIDKRDTRGGSS